MTERTKLIFMLVAVYAASLALLRWWGADLMNTHTLTLARHIALGELKDRWRRQGASSFSNSTPTILLSFSVTTRAA
jgi:hypothetical protein